LGAVGSVKELQNEIDPTAKFVKGGSFALRARAIPRE
jgi:hypothetical protein